MDEMPSSWWNRSGYRACILAFFLVLGIIATTCCCFSFYTTDEQKEEEPLLETLGNLSRIQRATNIQFGSNAKPGKFSENKEIEINGTAKDEILSDGIPTTENASTGSIVAQKNPNSDASPETNSGSFADNSPQIDFVPNNDPKFDTRPEINSASDSIKTENPLGLKISTVWFKPDVTPTENTRLVSISINSEFDQRNGGFVLQNDTSSVTSHRFNLRSVETSPGIELSEDDSSSSSNVESGTTSSNVESGTEDIYMISVSNETIPDTDQNYKNDFDPTTVGADTDSTDDFVTDLPEEILEAVESGDISPFNENYIENGPVLKPLTAAVEQLELPSSFDNHINTEQKFLLKENTPNQEGILINHVSRSLNKLLREDLDMSRNSIKGANKIVQRLKRSVEISPSLRGDRIERLRNSRFENGVKRSFVGYPNYYGLWYKHNPNRERMYRESLHKSDEFENIPLSLYMDNVLNRMAYVDSAKIDTSNGDQPLYMKKFYRKLANPMPQDPTESGSSSTATEANEDAFPAESSGSSTSPSEPSQEGSPVESSGSSTSSTESNQEGSPVESSGSSTSSTESYQDGSPAESSGSSTSAPESTGSSSLPPKYNGKPVANSEGFESESTNENIPKSSTTESYEIPGRTESTSTTKRSFTPRRGEPASGSNRRDDDNEYYYPDTDTEPTDPTPTPTPTPIPTPTPTPTPTPGNPCLCDFNSDDLSVDFDCEETCKLHGKICIKKASEDSLSQDTKILKKNDARMKRDASSMKNLRMSRREQELFMKPNFNLFSILVPKREIVRRQAQ